MLCQSDPAEYSTKMKEKDPKQTQTKKALQKIRL